MRRESEWFNTSTYFMIELRVSKIIKNTTLNTVLPHTEHVLYSTRQDLIPSIDGHRWELAIVVIEGN